MRSTRRQTIVASPNLISSGLIKSTIIAPADQMSTEYGVRRLDAVEGNG